MKLRLPLALATAVLSACFSFASTLQANPELIDYTILSFDGNASNSNIISGWGSYASVTTPYQGAGNPGYTVYGKGTPNIAVSFTAGVWQTHNLGSWGLTETGPEGGKIAAKGVAQIESVTSKILFTPERKDEGVRLSSFNFNGHKVGDSYKFKVTVTGSLSPDIPLFEQEYSWTNNASVIHNGGAVVDFKGLTGKTAGESLTLTLTLLTGEKMNIAIDNILLSQAGYATYNTVLSRVLANNESSAWVGAGWKNGTEEATWTDSTVDSGGGASFAAGTGSSLTLLADETRSVEHIALTQGDLTISGGTLNLINVSTIDVRAGSTLNLNTTVTVSECDTLSIWGAGLVVLKKDQIWNNLSGDGKLQLDADLTLNGDSIGIGGISLSGSGNLYKEGTGTTLISDISGMTGEGKVQVNAGVVKFAASDAAIGEQGKRIQVNKGGTVSFDAATAGIRALAPSITGNGTLALLATGGTSGTDEGMALDLSQTGFTGDILMNKGVLNVNTSNLVNKDGKSDGIISLDGGGGLLATASKTLSNEISVGKEGFLRANKDCKLTLNGGFSALGEASGTLSVYGPGEVILQGDFARFRRALTAKSGSNVTLDCVGNFAGFYIDAATANFTKGSNIVAAGFGIKNTMNVTYSGKFTSEGLCSFEVNSKLTLKEGANMSFGRIKMSDTGTSNNGTTLDIEKGASFYITTGYNYNGNTSSVVLGHWQGNATVNIRGLFEAQKGIAYMAISAMQGTSTVNIYEGGIANFYGANISAAKHTLNLEGGTLNLGEKGLTSGNAGVKVKVNGGHIGIFSSQNGIAANLELQSDKGVTFNTGRYDLVNKKYTNERSEIKVTSVISQADGATGTLIKEGMGTLVLSGANTYKGGSVLKLGTLSLANANALGADTFRNLTVEGNSVLTSSVAGKTIDNLTVKSGAILDIGGLSQVNSLTIGTLSGTGGGLALDLSSMEAESDSLSLDSIAGDASFKLKFNVKREELGSGYTRNILKGIGAGNAGKISGIEHDYRNSLSITGSESGGNYQVTVSGSFDSANLAWVGTSTSGTWKIGTTGGASWTGATAGQQAGFFSSDKVTFGVPNNVGTDKFHTVNLEGALAAESVLVTTDANHHYRFTNATGVSGYLTGNMSLTKEGLGTLVIDTKQANDYSGETIVNGGVLEFKKDTFAGFGAFTVGKDGTLKSTDIFSSNTMTIAGTYELSLAGGLDSNLGTLSKITWQAGSSLCISSGIATSDVGLFKNGSGPVLTIKGEGAFDLAGKDRTNDKFDAIISGQGEQLADGTYTGALFNSVNTALVGVKTGLRKLTLDGDATISMSGPQGLNFTNLDGAFYIHGELDLSGNTLTKTGYGRLGFAGTVKEGSSGTIRIAQGAMLLDKDLSNGIKIEVLAGAGFSIYTDKLTLSSDITLDNSSVSNSVYRPSDYARIYCYTSTRASVVGYSGNVSLVNGGAILLGWGERDNTNGLVGLLGDLSGTGTLYVDASACPLFLDSDTSGDRMRHLYVGAEIAKGLNIQMVGIAALQFGTANSGLTQKNATIDGLSITGGREHILKFIATGADASYTGLKFATNAGESQGMELRVQNGPASFLTTLRDTSGVLETINVKSGAKLTMNGVTDLSLNDNLTLEGTDSTFTLGGGSLVTNGRLLMKELSVFVVSEGAGSFESKKVRSNGRGVDMLTGASMQIKGGTVTFAGRTGIGVGPEGGVVTPGNYATVAQSGGTVNLTDVLMSEFNSNGKISRYDLSNGQLNVTGDFQLGLDGSATLAISGGTATINKLSLGSVAGAGQSYSLEVSGTGRLNLGSDLVSLNTKANSTKSVILSGGTLGATKNWATSLDVSLKKDTAVSGGVIVDTTLVGTTPNTAASIKWLGTVKDHVSGTPGSLTVGGMGSLELAGVTTFTGEVTVKDSATFWNNTTNVNGTLSASEITLKNTATFRMGGDNKKAGNFDVLGGTLLLDKTGAAVGNVDISGSGRLNMEMAGVKAADVKLSGGSLNVSKDAMVQSLVLSGGVGNVTSGTLAISNNSVSMSGSGVLKFTGNGTLNTSAIVTMSSGATVELGASQTYLFGLSGDAGDLVVNDADVKAVYNGAATGFKGMVDVKAGQLTLGNVMTNATAKVTESSRLIFSGATEQVKNVSGAGKVSFSNTAINITQNSLMNGFEGNLFVDTGHRVTFTGGSNASPTTMIGAKTTLEFGGNGSGVLVLNKVKETVADIILSADGTIELDKSGSGSSLYLSGDSWYGNGTDQTVLTLDVGSNSVFVKDLGMTDKQLDRLLLISDSGSGKVVLNTDTGELSVDVFLELRAPFVNMISQSYMLTENHPDGGTHTLTDNTRIRALSIVSSDTATVKNTELKLNSGVKLGLKIGELSVSGDAAYTITGGTLGMSASSINPEDLLGAQFTIMQAAKGLLTITSDIDNTVHELRKTGAGDLLMSGNLSNKGGLLVEGGKLTLTGQTKAVGTQLRNKATLVLGNGTQGYTVNYVGLDASARGSITTFSALSKVDKGFVVNNVGTLNLKMGEMQEFSKAFTGGGTTVITGKTNVILPQGSAQSFTIEKDSSLTFLLAQASATGLLMNGEGKVTLDNTSGGHLNFLSATAPLGTSWQGFSGTLVMKGASMSLDMGLMGEKAGLEVSANSRINDIGGAGLRNYQVKLGDGATWNLSDGATYKGTLALGSTGNLLGQGIISMNSDISGGTLNVSGGTFSLGGANTHLATIVGADTTVIGTSAGAFGQGLQLTGASSQAQIMGEVVTGTLNVADGAQLKLTQGSLTVTGGMNFMGILSGAGDLNLQGNSLLAGTIADGDTMEGATVRISEGELTVLSELGKATLEAGTGGRLTISGNAGLADNILILNAGSTLNGGADFNGILKVKGNGSDLPEDAVVNGGLNVQSLHLLDPTATLQVNGSINVTNGGSFILSDVNAQDSLQGAIVKAKGTVSLSGVFGVDVDVNNSFANSQETMAFQLFKGDAGLNITAPEGGQSVRLDIDPSMKEFFKLNQENFSSTGTITITRTEMTCYLLDPTYVTGEGVYADGYTAPNRTSYLGANANNDGTTHPEIFFFDRSYTIGGGDNAYRLTSGDAWMNFHVAMTDQQLGEPTKLIVRDNWMSKEGKAGGVILSVRGNADNTYTGGTQIFQSKVKVDGTLNGSPAGGTLASGDVYFFGTGTVEAIGENAEIILNTGGNGDKTEYLFYNEFQLQQGAVLTQTASKNLLMGNLTIKDMGTLRNLSDEDMILSGSRLNANNLEIQGAEDSSGAIVLEGVMGDKVTAKFTLADLNNSGKLNVGRNATANITSLYVDKGSSVKVSEGGILSVKEIKNGGNGAGDMYMSGGTLRLMGDYAMTRNGALFHVTENSYFDTNGYYLDINQDISGWSQFTVNGGGTMVLNGDTNGYYSEATIDGKNTSLQIASGKTLTGTWSIQNGGTLRTEENVILSGTINVKAGGNTSFGVGTTMKGAVINMKSGASYAGFLKGEGSTINFESGSHFQVKTEDLRKLTETAEDALLIADQVNIENGKGFFSFSGGDGIINNAIIDSGLEKTLILGTESLTVGGLDETKNRSLSGTSVLELTTEQLASMVGETTYRWLSFELSAEKSGESGAKINLTVTRNVDFSELAQTSNEVAIAPTLSYIGMEGGKADSELEGQELNELGLALTKAKDNAGQMLSNISLSTSSVMAGYSVQRENLRRHTLELRDRAVQERPCALRNQYETLENTVWASGQGGTYSVDGDNNAVGHTTSLWGGQLGVSRCVNDNLVLGLAFTYTSSDINLDQGMGSATSDAYYIDLYAKYHKDNWNVTGIITGGFTDLSTERNMAIEGFNSSTKGTSSGNQLMGMVEVGYEFDLDGDRSNIIEPFAALTAGYSSIDGFEESGAGSAGLNVASQSDTSCSIGAGVRYVKEFSTSSDELLRGRFEVRAMILQDLTDNEVDVEARFIGANGQGFSQKSTEIGKTGILLGTGVVVPTSANMAIFADLNGEFRSSETGCNANIGVKYSF